MTRQISPGEEKIINFLETYHPYYIDTTRLFLDISVREKSHPVDALAKLRDVTDHLFRATSCINNEEEVSHHLGEAAEALKKAGIGVAQARIEHHLVRINLILKTYPIKRLIYTEIPEYGVVQSELTDIETGLVDLRSEKGSNDNIGKSLDLAINTYRKAISLHRKLTPTRLSLIVRLLLLFGIALSGVFLRPVIDKYVNRFTDSELPPAPTPLSTISSPTSSMTLDVSP